MVEMTQQGKQLKTKCLKLLHAVRFRELNQIVQILNDNFPIDTPISDSGMSVLASACVFLNENRDLPIYQAILQHGANVNIPDDQGRNPLHIAARSGN